MKIVFTSMLIALRLQLNLGDLRKLIDDGLEAPKKKEEIKQYIYQRIKLDISNQNTIPLNYGLNNETFSSQIELQFKIDLQYP